MTDHWTVPYIGLPYAADGEGPDAFNCWALFRHVQRRQFAREVPFIATPTGLVAQVRLFRERADTVGWRRLADRESRRDGDGLLMTHSLHPHHIGVYVEAVRGALHAIEGAGSVLHSKLHLELGAWSVVAVYRPEGE